MTYEETIRQAESKCDEWFIKNPDFFYDKARLIAERRKAWEKELEELNPTVPKSCWLNGTNENEKVEVIVHEPKNPEQKRKEPSIIDPIFTCVGKYPLLERKTVVSIPQDKEEALLIYAACLLILHDGAAIKGNGLQVITKDIWPEEWAKWAVHFFNPHGNDRTPFIEAALRHVEADFVSKQGKGGERIKGSNNIAPINVNISGDVKAGNLQIGHDSFIYKNTEPREKKKRGVKNILKIIAAVVAFLGSLLGVLNHLGWLGQIKAFILNIFEIN